ncbi:MAG TPA: hypothetical protein DC064_15880, partial [Cyanobacteria bacterium UBA9273]|nr:hypothetical protein [Cyanobacteria bacterium UBA9273]
LTAVGGELNRDRQFLIPAAKAASSKVANGQIIQINGEVKLDRAGRVIHPKTGTLVYPGDKLLTANGAKVLLQCADLTIQSVQAGQNEVNGCASETEQAECTPGTYKCPHRSDRIAWSDRLDRIPYIISPRRTALLNPKPILRWHPVAGAKSYTVTLEGDGVQWQTQLSDTQVIYPGDPPLKPGGHYTLTVETDTGVSSLDEPVKPGGLGFSMLDANQTERVELAVVEITQQSWTEQAKAIALANLYTDNGLNAEAIATLETLVAGG